MTEKEEIIDFEKFSEKEKKRVLKLIENKGKIETEIVPYYELTKAKKKELEPIVKKYLKDAGIPFSIDTFFRGAKTSKSQIIIAKHDGKPIGFTNFGIKQEKGKPKPYLMGTFVEEKYRGKGIGSKLNRKRMYAIRMRRHEGFDQGKLMTKEGEALQVSRKRQWKKIKTIPQNIFERARKKRKH